jgi:PAT family beta-lactamase induction signal transducer AmpG
MGEPARHREPAKPHGLGEAVVAYFSPLAEFLRREGALVVLLFVLIHKIGDTLANLTLRLLFKDLGFSNDEVAFYDVGVGFVALLVGIFVGGLLYARLGMKRSVLISLVLMAVSNLSFAALAAAGHSNLGMAAAVGFENFAASAASPSSPISRRCATCALPPRSTPCFRRSPASPAASSPEPPPAG